MCNIFFETSILKREMPWCRALIHIFYLYEVTFLQTNYFLSSMAGLIKGTCWFKFVANPGNYGNTP